MANPLLAPVMNWLRRLRHPQLFMVAAVLFGLDMLIPDALPFIDELLLATLTLWLGARKRKRQEEPAKDG